MIAPARIMASYRGAPPEPVVPSSSTFSPPPIPANSTVVHTAQALQSALTAAQSGADITLGTSITTTGLTIPRRAAPGVTLRCAPGVIITGSASRPAYTPVIRAAGDPSSKSGVIHMIGVRVDGANYTGETYGTGFDFDANIWMKNLVEFSFEYGVSMRSRRCQIFLLGASNVTVRRSFFAWGPRDPLFPKLSPNVLIEDNLFLHLQDDISCHSATTEQTRRVVIKNNRIFDCYGIKTLGGSAAGTVAGRPAGVFIEGNLIHYTSNYGIRLGHDAGVNEGTFDQRNITVTGNEVWNVRDRGNYASSFWMACGSRTISDITVSGNTFARKAGSDHNVNVQREDVYPEGYPEPIQEWLDLIEVDPAYKKFPSGSINKTSSPNAFSTNLPYNRVFWNGWSVTGGTGASALTAQNVNNTFINVSRP